MPVPEIVEAVSATRFCGSQGALHGSGAALLGLGLAPTEREDVGVGETVRDGDGVGAGSGPTTNMRHAPGHAPSHTKISPVVASTARHLPYLRAITFAESPSPA